MAESTTIYTMVFDDSNEEWHYYKDDFNEEQFENGFMDYYILVENGIIKQDSYNKINKGKMFTECYNIALWDQEE